MHKHEREALPEFRLPPESPAVPSHTGCYIHTKYPLKYMFTSFNNEGWLQKHQYFILIKMIDENV